MKYRQGSVELNIHLERLALEEINFKGLLYVIQLNYLIIIDLYIN